MTLAPSFGRRDCRIPDGIAHVCAAGETAFWRSHDVALLRYAADKSNGMPGRHAQEAQVERARRSWRTPASRSPWSRPACSAPPAARCSTAHLDYLDEAIDSVSARFDTAMAPFQEALVTAYHLLACQTTYQDPGVDYYDRRHTERARRRAIQALERRGYCVILEPAA